MYTIKSDCNTNKAGVSNKVASGEKLNDHLCWKMSENLWLYFYLGVKKLI